MLEDLDKPYFTDPNSERMTADPLGANSVVESLYRSVFPGINNVVRFIRVYSAICWMVRRIIETADSQRDPDIADLSKAGLEKIQLLLTWYNTLERHAKGLPGSRRNFPKELSRLVNLRYRDLDSSSNSDELDVTSDDELTNGADFLQAVQYGPSLVNGMQFLRAGPIPGTYGLGPAGEILADAYELAISEHERKNWLGDLKKVRINAETISTMSEMLDLFTPSKHEVNAFVDQYYPETNETALGPNWRHRHHGLTLAMRAVLAEQQTADYRSGVPLNAIRFAMARAISHDGQFPILIEDCEQTAAWWMGLQLRQYFRAVQLTALRLCESWIHRATQRNMPRDIENCAASLGEQLEATLPEAYQLRVDQMLQLLETWRGDKPSLFAAGPSLDPEQRIESLMETLEKKGQFVHGSGEESEALQCVYCAVMYIGQEVANLKNNTHFSAELPSEWITLEKLAIFVQQFKERSPAQLMTHFMHHYVILQHFRVAQDRTMRDGRNRFLIIKSEHGLERTSGRIDFVNVDYMTDRLRNALFLLEQCKFLTHKHGNYLLTAKGVARLKKMVS